MNEKLKTTQPRLILNLSARSQLSDNEMSLIFLTLAELSSNCFMIWCSRLGGYEFGVKSFVFWKARFNFYLIDVMTFSHG